MSAKHFTSVIEVRTAGEEETFKIAAEWGAGLVPGSLIALSGPLGAGKTVFVKGIAQSFGIDPSRVSSPTFTFVHRHRSPRGIDFYHVDLFRVRDKRECMFLGIEDLIGADGIVAVEWAEKAGDLLGKAGARIDIEIVPSGRRITIS